jgi:hypothetical protein
MAKGTLQGSRRRTPFLLLAALTTPRQPQKRLSTLEIFL